jgi:hypothetical protein
VGELLKEIFNDPLVVVAPAQNVIESRETMRLTRFFLKVELSGFELVVADHTPVVAGGIHREARRKRTIHADDHGVLAGSAIPGEIIALHEVDHLPKASVRIYHLITASRFSVNH